MQEPSFSLNLPNVEFNECAATIIPINDDNYRATIDWFKACLRLSQNLPTSERDDYELKVIGNVKSSLTDFFQRTELSLSTLIGLEREVTAMIQGLGPPVAARYKQLSLDDSDDVEECDSSCTDPGEEESNDPFVELYKRFLWVAIASVILLILLIIVLGTMCWLRKYIERDMKEIFVACPSKGDLKDMPPAKKSPPKGKGADEEYPEGEEDYGEEYGEDPYAYPVRFWMTPFGRKRQSVQRFRQGKFTLKKAGANDSKMNHK